MAESARSTPGEVPRHLPGEPGIWMFIVGDLVIFGGFFAVYLYYRNLDLDLYLRSQALLNQGFGVANTFVLLTSSWFAANAVQAARQRHAQLPQRFLVATFLCGVCFCVFKVFEYGEKLRAGITPNENEFFIFYFVFTGIHLLHVFIGMGLLTFVWTHVRKEAHSRDAIQLIEIGVSFWHLVDLLWIVLFALLYLIR